MSDPCDLLDAAGVPVRGGYLVGETTAGIVDGARPVVLAAHQGTLWLLAVVGLDGAGHYPEDDLAEEAGLRDVLLDWHEGAERAVLARELRSAGGLRAAVEAFVATAADVEAGLVGAGLGFRPVPPGEDPCERGPLEPPGA